jgi:hypothetical protein
LVDTAKHTSNRLPPDNRIRMLQTILAAGAATAHRAGASDLARRAVHSTQVLGARARGGSRGRLDLEDVSYLYT